MACDPFVHKATARVMPIRRFGNVFSRQCPKCFAAVGKPIAPDALDDGVLPRDIPRAQTKPRDGGRTGLGGRGNSRRRKYEARFREKDWPIKRDACLAAADWECAECGGIATQADHKTYDRFETRNERPSDLQAVCGPCNLALRSERMGT